MSLYPEWPAPRRSERTSSAIVAAVIAGCVLAGVVFEVIGIVEVLSWLR